MKTKKPDELRPLWLRSDGIWHVVTHANLIGRTNPVAYHCRALCGKYFLGPGLMHTFDGHMRIQGNRRCAKCRNLLRAVSDGR